MSLRLREDLYRAKKGKMTLNNEEINRYSRHLTLPEVGMGGQLKLKEAKVLMIGAGVWVHHWACIWVLRELGNWG